ncbi:PR domain zinc finger protein 2 [Etheostoma spectabile]|uniref:PR domain zinc finger protein 2 n=1 Tax=Etheostoma spectabile TaxID=54343 RepID=UPI0013AFE10B|nr:PR domain zinc finger protein 2-like [Etheostoma spectabile]XP_032376555.1 PR domain zinc finger protein 2-like [Etheostoma spectabile]XP_032376556.1 PR domain zinc finger protein 2-like [Etheostoma spectabile]XP_032376557.1 PR domain zinc finger protein 2-like [Etheostoma spectabile]XP_032376558.1 PR domain zinc finger protein 2-like [Etheostoma spectabile]XP_032376559.1 PR domain zinc finger protein 2-like [Etheostoma spectabile]XP_032376560.1 PR domain zinc finger protein 2-like [Etheos
MEDSPHLYISEFGDIEDMEEEEEEDYIYQEETNMESDMIKSLYPDLHKHPNQDTERDWNCFPCQHCERHFTSKQGLEQHMHIHALANNETHAYKTNKSNTFFGSNLGQLQHEKMMPLDSVGSVRQLHTSSPTSSNTCILSAGDHTAQPDKLGVLEGHHACKYCEKIFTTHTNKQQHEHRIHEQHLQVTDVEKTQLPQEENLQRILSEKSPQETELGDNTAPAAVVDNIVKHAEQYMLDVSSNISENLSFYIDGKIVSTSTVSSCEAAEINSGSGSVGLDALILDPTQISQVLNTDSVTGKEIPGQTLARRRTATPPLLPQIKTELESEVVVSSSSSSLVSSLIENLHPQNTESTVVQKERTVFVSPKLKQLLEKQDGLKPTLALLADGQKPCSPVSLSPLPAGSGRFKRRTGSPPSSPQQNPTSKEETPDTGCCDAASTGQMDTQYGSPLHQTANVKDDTTPPVETEPTPILTESWSPATGGNSCNQQPLDLSNTVNSSVDVAVADAVLDLSLQKKTLGDSEPTLNLVPQAILKEGKSCMVETALMNNEEQNVSLGNLETPLVTDFTIFTGPDMMTQLEPMAEGLVYGLALPSDPLTPSPASLAPVALQPASPCTIAFASPVSRRTLPTAPSLITVLAPPHISNPSSQPIQVLAPNISSEPLVICTENALHFSECDLTSAFATTSSANPVTLSQSFDPNLNLPGHVFLSDPLALHPPIVESTPMSEVPFTPTVTLTDSLINSYNIASNTVLIECTIALEAPGSIVPAAVTLQENTAEPPAPTQMVVNHIEQQQIVSMPNPQTVDPTILMSSISESVTLSTTASVISDCPTMAESSPDPEPAVNTESPTIKEEEPADSSVSIPKISSKTSPSSEKAVEDESFNNIPSDAQQQTFTKNFICNVCDNLFHSMKELGYHVGDHADEWPFKCEFCVLLFNKPSALLDHRLNLHGVGKTYVCSTCTKEFVYLCNLKQHQEELHPGQQCTYTEDEKGKLRPQNYNNLTKVNTKPSVPDAAEEPKIVGGEVDVAAEELFTTIKMMASDGAKVKGPDVRLGINQHYPSFKPPPFPYHNRSPAGSVASATNFTTHNIPQTFSTAIRCTKCGKSFDNMPELHKHILACANASDKRRYTPKRNPIPLRHFAKIQNGVLSTTNSTHGLNASNRPSQSNRSKPNQESQVNVKFKVLNKKKKKLVQRVMPQRNKPVPSSNKMSPAQVDVQQEIFVCPHCSREFTMRRSRTKHMAVCPKKPKEVKKRKEGGISVTKENNRHLHRGVEEKQQASPKHKTRLQTSGPGKRSAILPVQTVFSNKRSKIIIKESTQPKQETPSLNELPIVRTFNPSMRQYSRVQHNVKGIPIKITIVKPQQAAPQKDELPPTQSREEATGAVTNSNEQSPTA